MNVNQVRTKNNQIGGTEYEIIYIIPFSFVFYLFRCKSVLTEGFPGGSEGNESTCKAGD